MPKQTPAAKQPLKIRELKRDSSKATRLQLKAAHESDPEFRDWEDLPEGVKKFAGNFHEDVRDNFIGKFYPGVQARK